MMPVHKNALILKGRLCTKCTFRVVGRVAGSVRGSFDGREASDTGHVCHAHLTQRVFVSANPPGTSLLWREKVSVGTAGLFVQGCCGVL